MTIALHFRDEGARGDEAPKLDNESARFHIQYKWRLLVRDEDWRDYWRVTARIAAGIATSFRSGPPPDADVSVLRIGQGIGKRERQLAACDKEAFRQLVDKLKSLHDDLLTDGAPCALYAMHPKTSDRDRHVRCVLVVPTAPQNLLTLMTNTSQPV